MQTKSFSPQAQPQGGTVPRAPHHLIVEDRHLVTVTGVTRVLSCDESGAFLETQQGMLTISGQKLQVSELSIQNGELKVYGRIDDLQYTEKKQSTGGLFRRLTR